MKQKIKDVYNDMPLAKKIRMSYFIVVIPAIIFLTLSLYNMWSINHKYEDMITSAVAASEFSLDFKKDFDNETYLVIVENKTVDESGLRDMIAEATRVVETLAGMDTASGNDNRLKSISNYLSNLDTYTTRIEENLIEGNKYEENIEIWENDVQIVTGLIRESILQYIYYEIQYMQTTRAQYQATYQRIFTFSILGCGAVVLVLLFLSYYIPRSMTRPIKRLSEVTDQVAKGDLSVRSDITQGAEVGVLSESLNSMIDKINELLSQVTTEQIRLRKAELELLQSQINPHFLYNTLDTIVWLAEAGNQKKVVSMVGSLSDFFRTSLNQGKDIILIKEELQHARSYLEIQQVRYQDILEYEIDVDDSLNDYTIPKITIQPLIENALYHGIKNKRGKGKITVYSKKEDEAFVLLVEDNGKGMTKERLNQVRNAIDNKSPAENEIYGLYNVNERIRLKFGDEYGIFVDSADGEGTVVSVRLPYAGLEPLSEL